MEKIKLEVLALLPSSSQSGSFALMLGEESGNRRLPIIIGMFEAQSIAIEIEKIEPNRPMTHDLFKFFARNYHYTITQVVITEISEGIFFAKIHCSDGLKDAIIDSRPSDAIAIALRFNAPIYALESLMSEASISVSEDLIPETEQELLSESIKVNQSFSDLLKDTSVDDLKKMLDEALQEEEYEKAVKIRDEIDRRN
ncbi:MAG: bifunctional nuclease family protein [Pseudarcicella sp.]|nr:bifunctional nuclease family protein [Pseudarcicella sp.]MBP6411287.1 bifunctional nuclease family protein [Pseudarcicella sp.]